MSRAMGSQRRIRWGLFIAAVALCAVGASASVTPARRQQAVDAFNKAEKMRTALAAQPEGRHRKEAFKQVIDAYYEVARLNPAYAKTPLALQTIAVLYRQMGSEFSSDSYFLESIKTYRFLAEQYPKNHIARDAWFTVGEVYQRDLEDPDAARKAFQNFITMYPKSEKAEEARKRLTQLNQLAADRGTARAEVSTPPPPAAHAPIERVSIEKVVEERSSGLRQVTAVRRWVGPNYLRIVIEVDGEVKFESIRLSNPDRIVINLQTARLSHELGARTFPVENGFLRQIRVAQFSSDVARVVLDAEKIEAYSIFSLPNPFRLVIDVQGTLPRPIAKPQIAKTVTPAPATNPESRKAPKVAPPLPTIPAPSTPVETAATTPAPGPAQVKTESEPSTPPGYKEETVAAAPSAEVKPRKKSKEKAQTTAAIVTPAIQPASPMEDGSRTLTRALGLKIGRIVIDPGHGGHDTGTLGPTGLEEKEVVLDVGLKLRKLLEQNTGCEVVMTRSDDTFIPLEERTAIANEKSADLFISVHANASPDKSARGIETYYLNFTSNRDALEVAARENASSQEAVHQLQDLIKKIAMTEKIEESQDFASQVQHQVFTHVTKASGAQRDRGIKKAPFVVLIGANMPSVLAEISFLTNPKDERLLRRPDYRQKIAEALYEGIVDYLKTLGEVKSVQRVAADQTSAAARPN
jgi:N-acetylmuramoyl-L-alanine amidase